MIFMGERVRLTAGGTSTLPPAVFCVRHQHQAEELLAAIAAEVEKEKAGEASTGTAGSGSKGAR
jgi:hypothetical protein